MSRSNDSGKEKDDAPVVPFPLPKTPAPANPEPRHTCGTPGGEPCKACS